MKSVTLHDENVVELWDLSSNFVFTEEDIGKNRALASVHKLQELNNAVAVSTLTGKLTKEQLSDFQVSKPFLYLVYLRFLFLVVNNTIMIYGHKFMYKRLEVTESG